eukprot:493308-Rhodomonas_salina.1
MDWKEKEKSKFEGTNIFVSGAIQSAIGTFEEAASVGKALPETLSKHCNTLSFKLLPVSLLDSQVRRMVREIDDDVLAHLSRSLKTYTQTMRRVNDLQSKDILKSFPRIKKQIEGFATASQTFVNNYRTHVRTLLPALKDGAASQEDSNKIAVDLMSAVQIATHNEGIATKFAESKERECEILSATVANLLKAGLANFLDNAKQLPDIVGNSDPRILLSIAGKNMGKSPHPRETQLQKLGSSQAVPSCDDKNSDDSEDSDDEEEEWCDDDTVVAYLRQSCAA